MKNETIVDRVVERLKAQPLGDLITEEDLHDIVKQAMPLLLHDGDNHQAHRSIRETEEIAAASLASADPFEIDDPCLNPSGHHFIACLSGCHTQTLRPTRC